MQQNEFVRFIFNLFKKKRGPYKWYTHALMLRRNSVMIGDAGEDDGNHGDDSSHYDDNSYDNDDIHNGY